MNLLDGSAVWLQSVTQALVAAGCSVTLVLKAPVRTDRLVAPLLAMDEVTVRPPHAEQLLPGLTQAGGPERSLTVAQAGTALAALDAPPRPELVVPRGRHPPSAPARPEALHGRRWIVLRP